MVSFAQLLPPVLFAFIFIPATSATSVLQLATHRTHYIGAEKNVEFETFHPEPIFEASFYFLYHDSSVCSHAG